MLKVDSKGIRFTWATIRKQLIHLNLQLLYECNFRCKICDFWKEEYNDAPRLSLQQIQIIADKLKALNPMIVSLGGGEPLLHNDILEIIRVLAKNNFPVMISNGWYVTPELAKNMFDAGLHEISISIDYADPRKHDEQRGKEGAYDRAVQALRILKASRTKPHQRIHLISVVMDDNIADIEPLIRLAREIGITYLVTLYSDSRGKKEKYASDEDISLHLLKLKEKYREFVVIPGYISRFTESFSNGRGISPCYAGRNLFNIGSRGDVSLCIDRLDSPVGNIFTDDMTDLREKLLGMHENNRCANCWTSCRGAIESLMYDRNKISNIKAFYESIKNIPVRN